MVSGLTLVLDWLGHWYICWSFSAKGSVQLPKVQIALASFGTLAVFFVQSRFRLGHSSLLHLLHWCSAHWYALYVPLLVCSVLGHIANIFHVVTQRLKGKLIVLFAGVLFLYGYLSTCLMTVDQVELHVQGLQRSVTIAHLTDQHLGTLYGRRSVERVCGLMNELKPDLAVITGDLFDGSAAATYDMIEPFDALSFPVYFVTGNHDLVILSEVLEVMKHSKLIWLRNTTATFRGIRLRGLDYVKGRPPVLPQRASDATSIEVLLYHVPAYNVEELSEAKITLHLAGHTHGGEIFPYTLYAMHDSLYIRGLYSAHNNATHVYVSEGLGSSNLLLRIGTRSTLGLIKLIPASDNNT